MSAFEPRDVIRTGFADLAGQGAAPSQGAQAAAPFAPPAPLLAPTEDELSVAFAENLFDLFRAMSHLPAAEIQEQAQLSRHLAPPREAFVNGFGVPEWAGQAWVDATLSFGIERAPWRCYVGRLNGTPVASNMLFNGAIAVSRLT